ncbi:Protein L-Myc [Cuculus canorus]|uniref:Protein L-Myc n=1 Tax=Cuculus canorus TaxID=55661 RepID=A0A091GRY7_CUCCA|nr:Protein L-Myc [Cuculus canorus]
MEFDSYQHYFYDHDAQEDFHRSTAPSEDIWKKFELVPTPPLSPLSPPGAPGAEERPGRLCPPGEEPEYLIGTGQIFGNLSAFILKDCMWSGFSARERLEKAMTEKLSAGSQRAAPQKPCFAQDLGCTGARSPCCPQGQLHATGFMMGQDKLQRQQAGCSASIKGEEIDVVTVEKRQSLSLRKPVTITLRADPLDPCMKHFHISVHQQQHNYAARSPPDTCPLPEPPQQEEDEPPRAVEPAPAITLPEPGLPKAGSSPGSDSEDIAKRKNHNYLERKRRNDLRSRFLALRDQVPGLASCPKTPKVVILSKSSEYLQSLLSAERRLVAEKRQLRLQQTQLLKRMAHLKGH